MERFLAGMLVGLCLAGWPSPSAAAYYGRDAARTLVERLQQVPNYPRGHARVDQLPGYQSYAALRPDNAVR
ncbi:MAG: hypothetical protein GTO03_15125 [Planctomycetales bacterium]|nr:hypothetical protein [Planctomycetales bacterium]